MKKYTVELIPTESFYVKVEAESEQEASDKAEFEFTTGNYKEVGNCNVNIGEIEEDKQISWCKFCKMDIEKDNNNNCIVCGKLTKL